MKWLVMFQYPDRILAPLVWDYYYIWSYKFISCKNVHFVRLEYHLARNIDLFTIPKTITAACLWCSLCLVGSDKKLDISRDKISKSNQSLTNETKSFNWYCNA